MIIGIDPHKASHTATALDTASNTPVASIRIDATHSGYRRLLRWSRQFSDRRWAIENARGLGCNLAQWLLAQDEMVLDVATTATARVRELSRGGRRKTDVIDASAAASVAALQGDAVIVDVDEMTVAFALLEERRADVAAQRVRSVNQLHALLRDLVPGGARTGLKANAAAAVLRGVRPVNPVERVRKKIGQELVREVRALDARLIAIADQITVLLEAYGTSLLEVDGVGPVLAARLIGRTGRPSRFDNSDKYAAYTGTAPIEVSSGERVTHRLSRSGDRKLNSAIHLVAVTQVRMVNSAGRAYFDKKLGEGKTRNEAMRSLKRKIAAHVWRRMLADERLRSAGSGLLRIAA